MNLKSRPMTLQDYRRSRWVVEPFHLVGVAPREIRIGMPVRVVFDDITDDVTLPKFAPA